MRAALGALYPSYREREPMTSKVLRDRTAIPALDELMSRTADPAMAGLADALAAGFDATGEQHARLRAAVALALDFWSWQRLKREGLEDDAAAELMADLVACAAA